MNFRKTLLFYCDQILQRYGFTPMVGGELEFYCDSPQALEKYRPMKGARVVEEKGDNQFEIRTPVFFDALEFITYLVQSKKHLLHFARKEKIKVSFSAKPFRDMPGNSMHIHLNFLDKKRYNVFDLCRGNEPLFLIFSVGGLMNALKESMIFFAPDKSCYARYKKSMFTPIKMAWGNNNRTAALRIISKMNDIRRIEHRVPCSDADPLAVVTAIMVAAYYGLENEIIPPKKIYGNAFDAQYKLPYLPRSLVRAQKLFYNGNYRNLFIR